MRDKIKHFVVGFLITFGFSFLFHWLLAFWLGSVTGVLKEVYDSRKGGSGFDNYDLFGTAGGSLFAILISLLLGITPIFL